MGENNVVKLKINPENSERVTLIKAIKILQNQLCQYKQDYIKKKIECDTLRHLQKPS